MLGTDIGQVGDFQSPRRQITADSFRALSARLSGLRRAQPVVQPPAEEAQPAAPVHVAEPVEAREAPHIEDRSQANEETRPEAEPLAVQPEMVEAVDIEPPETVEILQDMVEAAEDQAEQEPERASPAEPADEIEVAPAPETIEEEAVEDAIAAPTEESGEPPVAETEILHELVEAAESAEQESFQAEEQAVFVEHEPAEAVQEADLARIDWQVAEAEADQAVPETRDEAPPAIPERAPDEATAFAFAEAEAEAGPKPEDLPQAVEDEAPPPDIAHIRNLIAEGHHWPDEATIAPDTNSGEIARSLLDIMSMPQAGSLPQERALAADTLLRLIPRLPEKSVVDLVERVCVMEAPSQLLVRRLINDPRIEVSAPLLERGTVVSDRDLIAVIEENDAAKQRLIARRRGISPALSEALILNGDDETIISLLRNGQASFSIEAFDRLLLLAVRKPALRAPLATRPDLPAPVAFELFWCLPAELRRYVLSRFLTDSETISKILKLSQITIGSAISRPEDSDLAAFSEAIANQRLPEATGILARLANISPASSGKIVADSGKEPLTVAMKAAGLSRSQFDALISRLLGTEDSETLRRIFDQLSFNKARVLITYWDWAATHTGPYAKAAA